MYVTAEIPSKTTTQELYKIVTQHMIHGPCGVANSKPPCRMVNVLNNIQKKTIQFADGYPMYQRPDNGLSIQNGVILDNRWVVPYNPYLCSKYSARSSITAVKYLFEYVYKGHDRVMASIQSNEHNEIQ